MCRYVVTESLNTDMVKAENPEAVVATEPQGKHICTSLLTSVVIHLLLQKPKCKTPYYSRKQNSKCLNVGFNPERHLRTQWQEFWMAVIRWW